MSMCVCACAGVYGLLRVLSNQMRGHFVDVSILLCAIYPRIGGLADADAMVQHQCRFVCQQT